MPPSPYDAARRAFVTLLLQLGRFYKLALDVRRESPDSVILAAFRKVARAAHPDKGGRPADQQRLNVARDLFEEARSGRQRGAGRPAQSGAAGEGGAHGPVLPMAEKKRKEFRINAFACLLTYQSFSDLPWDTALY